jgi:hypothetical protein
MEFGNDIRRQITIPGVGETGFQTVPEVFRWTIRFTNNHFDNDETRLKLARAPVMVCPVQRTKI